MVKKDGETEWPTETKKGAMMLITHPIHTQWLFWVTVIPKVGNHRNSWKKGALHISRVCLNYLIVYGYISKRKLEVT